MAMIFDLKHALAQLAAIKARLKGALNAPELMAYGPVHERERDHIHAILAAGEPAAPRTRRRPPRNTTFDLKDPYVQLAAIKARVDGVWDAPELMAYGPLRDFEEDVRMIVASGKRPIFTPPFRR